jgi:hypothetical protein
MSWEKPFLEESVLDTAFEYEHLAKSVPNASRIADFRKPLVFQCFSHLSQPTIPGVPWRNSLPL